MWAAWAQTLFAVDDLSPAAFARLPLTYTALLGLGYLLVYVVFPRFCARRLIQPRRIRPAGTLRREALLVASTFLIVSGITMGTIQLARQGVLRVGLGPVSPARLIGEAAVYFMLVDLYLYAIHRLTHRPFLYRHVHKWHHRTTTPTLLTAFAGHPIDTLLNGLFLPVLIYLGEPHFAAILLVSIHTPINNLLLHNGHEVFPRWWYARRATSWYATPLFHDVHHTDVVCHYGLVTTFWDRVFGTMKPGFDARVRQLHAARDQTPAVARVAH
jgi:sterol desaturase/sphingolipid hydroxylase (fatty acid hydroxylase superfamily)